MSQPWVPILGVAAIAIALYYVGASAGPSKEDYVPVPVTDNHTHPSRVHGNRPDFTFTVADPAGTVVGEYALFDGRLWEPKLQLELPPGKRPTVVLGAHRYLNDINVDVGLWMGFRVAQTHGDNPKGDVGLDIGLRYSPVRLFNGLLAVDALISTRQIGGGVSVYPPANTVSPFLQHLGVGMAYLADYRGGAGWSPYVALSTTF